MTAQPALTRRYTPVEFKTLVETSETKYEFFDGKVFEWKPPSEASDSHGKMVANTIRCLENTFETRKL